MSPDVVGWLSAGILLLTLGRQVYVQWHSASTSGVSKWLFRGQIAASIGFVVYSYLLSNWVFVVTNALIGLIAVIGQARFWYRSRQNQATASAARAP